MSYLNEGLYCFYLPSSAINWMDSLSDSGKYTVYEVIHMEINSLSDSGNILRIWRCDSDNKIIMQRKCPYQPKYEMGQLIECYILPSDVNIHLHFHIQIHGDRAQ